MNYINAGKRDILIFPNFKEIEKIQKIRKEYDELANIIPPHITLAFPFDLPISNKDLKEKLEQILSRYQKIDITCKGISFSKNPKINKYYIFLNITEGIEMIKNIHNDIYEKVLKIPRPSNYIPHITLGTMDEIDTNIDLKETFETTVDNIIVESIGENEESIIEFKIELKKEKVMKLVNFLATDGISLNGILYNSENETNKIILAVHGMSSNCMKERDEMIAKQANKNNIDYFCFNNRGSELTKYIKRNTDGKKLLGGTSYEDVLEGYEDIKGAIIKLKELGYEEIYLQGHSLGCTKIVYTYNKLKSEKDEMLDSIKAVILLSLVDIPGTLNIYLGDKLNSYIGYAEKLEQEGKQNQLMPKEAFIHPVSVKTFLRYARDNEEINFASYGKDTRLEKINNIDKPLFMRWGNVNEMILQNAEDLVNMLNEIIKNPNKDINYIDGADHGYKDRREELAKQVINFIIKSADK